MNLERESRLSARLPEDVYEQIRNLPDVGLRIEITESIFKGLSTLLTLNDVEIDWKLSGPRPPKTIARVEDKIIRRNSKAPAADFYGGRFVTQDPRRTWLKDLIQSAYPLTPEFFATGKPTARDYRDPKVRESHIEKMNPHMSPIYSALHINFIFLRDNSNLYDIAEAQIMTHEELGIYKLTHDGYKNRDYFTTEVE